MSDMHVNCTSFHPPRKCLHQAASRRLLGAAECIVWFQKVYPQHVDPRIHEGCRLCTPINPYLGDHSTPPLRNS